MQALDRKGRTVCICGCGKLATHLGTANGIGLMTGCEFAVRVWVRDGTAATLRRIARMRPQPPEVTP